MTGSEPEDSMEQRVRRALPQLTQEQVVSLASAIERIIKALQPERVYVFGSHAKGSATAESDVDLLMIVPESDLPAHRRDQLAYQAVGPHIVPLDILVMTRQEFERRLPAVSSLPAAVEREGVVLYAA